MDCYYLLCDVGALLFDVPELALELADQIVRFDFLHAKLVAVAVELFDGLFQPGDETRE